MRVCMCVVAVNGLQVHRIGIMILDSQRSVIIGLLFSFVFLKLY